MFHKILVPLDGSPIAESALPPASYLAGLCSGEIILVRAILPPAPFSMYDTSAPDFTVTMSGQMEGCDAYLADRAAELRAQGRRVTTHAVCSLDPAEAILLLACKIRSRNGPFSGSDPV